MGAVGEWADKRKRSLLAMLVGAALGTILWFALSPALNGAQEEAVSWLLMGSYVVLVAATLLRAHRKAGQRRG